MVLLVVNFSVFYVLWLVDLGFVCKVIDNLLGWDDVFDYLCVFLMQLYDFEWFIVVMIYGLVFSFEVWVNFVNEVMGDDVLCKCYQIWEVYYLINVLILVNFVQICVVLV